MINPAFAISDEDVESFREHGFLKLKQVFSAGLVDHMKKLSTSEIVPPADNYGSGFSKLKYDIGNDDPTILELMGDRGFATAMAELTGQKLFFTQGLGFELEKNKSTGFPWHVGTQSFGFQRRQDAGFTIWTPLCDIDAGGQRGGMKYVSKKHLSGEFVYQHINLLPGYMRARAEAGEELGYDDFSVLKNSLLNSPQMTGLLDHVAVEDSFEPGDALIFDKYVLHRSVPLGEGPIPSRLAYALRFSSIDARYDKSRVDALGYPRVTFDYDVGSDFNEKVASQDGEQVYASRYFDGTRQARTLDVDNG
ncbi:phytanoyl-CoA dioxygenase family protein [Kitasatospora xanthocidica]|uniref:phytanoyl-CoA dioxygenase family protein n=1 Tax=Kitasatospora xanthocidica TaxID=83382 RepID=UPI0036E0A138